MCTFNIALDDNVVNAARKSFVDDKMMTAWMEEQITILLTQYSPKLSVKHTRKPHKHDSLMGIISNMPEIDFKRVHLKEKYGI